MRFLELRFMAFTFRFAEMARLTVSDYSNVCSLEPRANKDWKDWSTHDDGRISSIPASDATLSSDPRCHGHGAVRPGKRGGGNHSIDSDADPDRGLSGARPASGRQADGDLRPDCGRRAGDRRAVLHRRWPVVG